MDDYLLIPLMKLMEERLYVVWTFFLLATRFGAMMMLLPGIGMGAQGKMIRLPAILVFAFAAMTTSPRVPVPENVALIAGQLLSEVALGAAIAFVPLLIVAGVQLGSNLSATSAGLGASQLFDPTSGGTMPDVSRLFGDLTILTFLLMSGHYVIIHAVAGMGGVIVPGTFFIGEASLGILIDRTGHVFFIGVMVAAPVLTALLLTQFVMGLITRAVPTVNIFIISFPLTIGIGLTIMIIAMPDIVRFVEQQVYSVEAAVLTIVSDATLIDDAGTLTPATGMPAPKPGSVILP